MSRNSGSSSSEENMFVSVIDPQVSSFFSTGTNVDVHHLKDPSTGDKRPYLVTKNDICELQSIPADYSSFLVNGSYVVGNNSLYIVTTVDPLFWCLTTQALSQQQQWQPMEQILAEYDTKIVEYVDRKQLNHIFTKMSLGGDDECYYKFSIDKALTWLTQKQRNVEAILEKQMKTAQEEQNDANETNGAFSDSFNLGADLQKEQEQATAAIANQQTQDFSQQVREESIQIVCNYLNSAWQERFLKRLHVTETVLESEAQRRKRRLAEQETNKSGMPPVAAVFDYNDMNKPDKKAKVVEKPTTHGAKKLAKTNLKGMKKMSAFFGVAKKKSENNKN